ncbi:MAG: M23 family metallopeptidase [Bacteroidota bacterium]
MKSVILLLFVSIGSIYWVQSGEKSKTSAKANLKDLDTFSPAEKLRQYRKWDFKTKRDTSVKDLFPTIPEKEFDGFFKAYPEYISDGFDFPVGKPNAEGYYKAQLFGENKHLGEDWNGVGGGNTDLGDPVFSISNGLVTFSRDVCCGWGKVIRVVHRLPNHPEFKYIEAVYAHMHNVNVKAGDLIKRGQHIGTIGNAGGRYHAHLHFEMRNFINMSLGPGYSDDVYGYENPSDFISKNRP